MIEQDSITFLESTLQLAKAGKLAGLGVIAATADGAMQLHSGGAAPGSIHIGAHKLMLTALEQTFQQVQAPRPNGRILLPGNKNLA